ncbi:unnamed protein product [Prorocentrum cordatum]|uniref:Secreted protein n=1 Tax=Prorocentrum cordatum TaxID=2364126 RepID=A0ABN9TZ43_9DINO|nr:unnamed protein product [Polarella glacialis]
MLLIARAAVPPCFRLPTAMCTNVPLCFLTQISEASAKITNWSAGRLGTARAIVGLSPLWRSFGSAAPHSQFPSVQASVGHMHGSTTSAAWGEQAQAAVAR